MGSFTEATAFLDTLTNFEKQSPRYSRDFHLNKVPEMLACVGISGTELWIIHVAGTKGKGTTSYYLARLLQASGYRVGLFTSPHVFSCLERVQIYAPESLQNQFQETDFAALVDEFQELIRDQKASYFEAMTFLAYVAFTRARVYPAIFEVGLGGRLDATNSLCTQMALLTEIAFDHCALLGNDLASIAREKAGIVRPENPAFSVPQRPEVEQVLRACAPHVEIVPAYNRTLHMLGAPATQNFALAKRAAEEFLGAALSADAIQWAADGQMPFRLERRGDYLIDVGHNDSSIALAMRTALSDLGWQQPALYLGLLRDKEWQRIAHVVHSYAAQFRQVVVYDFDAPRPSGGKQIWEALKDLDNAHYVPDIHQLQVEAYSVFTGSFYAVEPLCRLLSCDETPDLV